MQRVDELFPVGVWCDGAVSRRDLQRIRSAGFNSIWTPRADDSGLASQADAAGLTLMPGGGSHAELHADAAATAADLRLWGWTALLRGARAIAYYAWGDLVESDIALTARGRAAAEFAGILTRNPALFAPLRPRATTDAASMTADLRISGAGEIEAGFLESRDALVLIAVSHAGAPQRATLTFAAGTKQEFWQNMETGDMVSFTMVKDEPTLTHSFAARDAMVLMIRKTSPYDRR